MPTSLVGRKLGMYQITELLGQGGMATVYKGYRDDIDRYVAIKVLPPHPGLDQQFIDRFRLEAKTIARLQHPHILPLYDYGVEDDIIYLVTAYVAGGSLATLMDRGSVRLPEIERLLKQIAGALDYAHREGVVHRDIKPDNILLDKEGNVLLADFGIVKIVSGDTNDDRTNPALTQTGGLVGTPSYMAPEQGSGEAHITGSADLYSLGVVVYEMLTGEPPYTADTPMQVVIKHITEPVPSPRDIVGDLSPQMESVILRALAKKPQDRYPNATAFAEDFARAARGEELLTQIPVSVKTPPPNQTIDLPAGPKPTVYLTPPPPSASTPQPTMIVQQGTSPLVTLGGFAIIAILIVVVVMLINNRPPAATVLTTPTPQSPTAVAVVNTAAPTFGTLNFSSSATLGDTVTLQVQNLNPVAADEVYVAWLINTKSDTSQRIGTLTINAVGNGVLAPFSDTGSRVLPSLFNSVIITREKKNAVGETPVGQIAYSGSVPTEVLDALTAIYLTAPEGIATAALANIEYADHGAPIPEGGELAGLLPSLFAESMMGQQHAGLAQVASTVGGMHLHNEHTINIFDGTEVDYDADGRGANPGFKKGVVLYLDRIEALLAAAATAPNGSDSLHGNIESVRVCIGNARLWVKQIVADEQVMIGLQSVEEAVGAADRSTAAAEALIHGLDANSNGQIEPFEGECSLSQIESYGLLMSSISLQQGAGH
ncbi:MAG: serine/threonine protein kinase [Chloroflexi bacterium]|nr:serine/threonine protein kinase [Chloroflexota bacterium]MCC6894360.1 protein kinase [Anaerolineae bacterium]